MLDAALSCYAERGYDGTRIRHIAERAEVSEGALYRHFRSKEELAQRLYGQSMGAYSEALREAAGRPGSSRERLQRCLLAALTLYRANPDAMTFALLRQHCFMPDLPADFAYPIQIVAGLIREGQHDGTVRDGDPQLLAAIFAGCLLRPLIVSQLSAPGGFDPLHETEHDQTIVDCAWAAVADPGRP